LTDDPSARRGVGGGGPERQMRLSGH